MKRTVSFIMCMLILLFAFIPCLTGCSDKNQDQLKWEEDQRIWEEKWKNLINERNVEFNTIMAVYSYGFTENLLSNSNYFTPSLITEKDEIDSILIAVSNLEFEKIKYNNEINTKKYLRITVNCDELNKDSETDKATMNETGSYYKDSLKFYVGKDGYVYVVQFKEPASMFFELDDNNIVFKSTATVNFEKLYEIYKKNFKGLG